MREVYLNIDMIKTGQKIKECIQKTGYTVKESSKNIKIVMSTVHLQMV